MFFHKHQCEALCSARTASCWALCKLLLPPSSCCCPAAQQVPAPRHAAHVQQAHTPPQRARRAAAPAPAACTPAARAQTVVSHAPQAPMQTRRLPVLACAARLAHTAARAPVNAWSVSRVASLLETRRSASAALLARILTLARSAALCVRLAHSPMVIGAAAALLVRTRLAARRSALPASLARLLAGMQMAACLARLATLLLPSQGSASSVRLARTQVSFAFSTAAAASTGCR